MSQIKRYLQPDERVLWSGKPALVPFIFSGLIGVPIGIILVIFAALWVSSIPSIGPFAFPFAIFSVIFILMGIAIVLGPLLAGLLMYRNTEYVITNQRIITQTGVIGLDTRFVELNKIQEVYVTVGLLDKIYGAGSIIAVTAGYVPVGTSSPYSPIIRPALKAVKHPYDVQKILQEAIKGK